MNLQVVNSESIADIVLETVAQGGNIVLCRDTTVVSRPGLQIFRGEGEE